MGVHACLRRYAKGVCSSLSEEGKIIWREDDVADLTRWQCVHACMRTTKSQGNRQRGEVMEVWNQPPLPFTSQDSRTQGNTRRGRARNEGPRRPRGMAVRARMHAARCDVRRRYASGVCACMGARTCLVRSTARPSTDPVRPGLLGGARSRGFVQACLLPACYCSRSYRLSCWLLPV